MFVNILWGERHLLLPFATRSVIASIAFSSAGAFAVVHLYNPSQQLVHRNTMSSQLAKEPFFGAKCTLAWSFCCSMCGSQKNSGVVHCSIKAYPADQRSVINQFNFSAEHYQ